MRGKEVVVAGAVLIVGITPAYAGKREYRIFPVLLCRDHPRVCGEKTKKIP